MVTDTELSSLNTAHPSVHIGISTYMHWKGSCSWALSLHSSYELSSEHRSGRRKPEYTSISSHSCHFDSLGNPISQRNMELESQREVGSLLCPWKKWTIDFSYFTFLFLCGLQAQYITWKEFWATNAEKERARREGWFVFPFSETWPQIFLSEGVKGEWECELSPFP
jgi:hypothetical protein